MHKNSARTATESPYLCGKNSLMSSKYFYVGLLAACSLAVFQSCSDRQTETYDSGAADQYAYFPLQIGKYIVYQVDSVVYDFAAGGGTLRDSSSTFVQELVSDTLRDPTGQLQYLIERSERKSPNDPWQLRHIGAAMRNSSQAIRTENNLRFLKLIFPMDRRSEWDGHIWIDENREIEIAGERMRPFVNWLYEVDSIDVQAILPFDLIECDNYLAENIPALGFEFPGPRFTIGRRGALVAILRIEDELFAPDQSYIFGVAQP